MTQFDFSSLNVADGRTARYTFHQISLGGNMPHLTVRPATAATKPYFNDKLKRVGKNARQITAGAISSAMLEEIRADDRRLYPLHIIAGWGYTDREGKVVEGSMPDKAGKPTPFSAEAATDFVRALPDWLFDPLRTFCEESANFLGDGEVLFDPAVAGKN